MPTATQKGFSDSQHEIYFNPFLWKNMDAFLAYISGNIPAGPLYYALLFLIAMAESIAIIGLAVPGSILIVCAGFLTAHGQGTIGGVITAAILGALGGDIISYLMGARLGYRFLRRPFFRKYLGLIRKAEMFFIDHGGKSLFFGRFAGPLRGLTPFIAGSARLEPLRFLGYALISCLLWGLAYPTIGRLGAASWRQVQIMTGRLSLLVTTLLVLLFVNAFFWRRIAPRLADRLATLRRQTRHRWLALLQQPRLQEWQTRHPRVCQFVADRFSPQHGSGFYLTMGLLCCAIFAGLFFFLLVKLPLLERIDLQISTFITHQHYPLAGRLMLICSGLVDQPGLYLWGFLLVFWLLLKGRNFSAAMIFAGIAGGQLLIFSLKQILGRPRPLPLYPWVSPNTPGFPSGHAFFALLLGGLTVYLMLGSIRNWQSRLSLTTSFSFLALLIGTSRVFIGAHWFSDVLAGWLLAALWLSFLITAMEVRRRLAGEMLWHRRWQPPGFDPRVEKLLWAAAASLALFGVIQHLFSLWSHA
jgi:undecaprenyl-diphosphatase